MNIAELFVNLSIKGTEKTVGAITSVRKGMADLTSTSIESKAAIVGAIYGFERLMQISGQMGTSLTNFTALTGMSAQALQQWQYAARQAGVSGQEIEGSLKGVQNAMTNMLLGKGAPEGLGLVAQKVGFDANKARDTLYVMQQLQKFAQQVSPDIGNQVLKSFGLSEGTISAMRRNAFRPEVFNRAPLYSGKEIQDLDKANIAWSNLSNKIQMAIGHFNALHGGQLVGDISKISDKLIVMVESFTKLSEKIHVFEVIGKIFEGWGLIFDGISSAIDKLAKSHPSTLAPGWHPEWQGAQGGIAGEGWLPNVPASPQNQTINNNINQNLNFQHDGKDHKKTGDSVKKSIEGAFRQMPAVGQGS